MRYIAAILVFIFIGSSFNARSQSTTVSGTADIARVMVLSVTNLTGVVSFNDGTDYTNGQIITNSATITVKSNVLWLINVNAQSTTFTTNGTSSTMPASVLGIRRNGTTTFLTMSTTAQTLKTGSQGNASVSGNTFNTDIYLNPGLTYSAGTYTIGVLFTISEQ